MRRAPCSKCGGTDLDIQFIEQYGVDHCICKTCQEEWVE